MVVSRAMFVAIVKADVCAGKKSVCILVPADSTVTEKDC